MLKSKDQRGDLMKLAEALILRSDYQKRIEQLKVRINNNIIVQEGDKPSENPVKLIIKLKELQNELEDLIKKINRTNNNSLFNKEKSISDVLTERDMLLERRNILSNIAMSASQREDRYSNSEIKKISVVDVSKIQDEVDILSKDYRILDTKIQEKNWLIDLIEE